MQKFNHHTHTLFCDGKAEPEAYIKAAIEENMSLLGFSSHAPLPYENNYAMQFEDYQKYINTLDNLKQKYHTKIEIYKALELDFIPDVSFPFEAFKERGLDYTIGGVHMVQHPESKKLWFIDGGNPAIYIQGLEEIFENDIQLAVESFFAQSMAMIKQEKPDIIAHFDKIKMHNKEQFFSTQDVFYKKLVTELLALIKSNNTIVELNTRGLYKGRSDDWFPSQEIAKQMIEMDIPITISADAHHPSEIGLYFEETLEMLKNLGLKELIVFQGKEFVSIPIGV